MKEKPYTEGAMRAARKTVKWILEHDHLSDWDCEEYVAAIITRETAAELRVLEEALELLAREEAGDPPCWTDGTDPVSWEES